MHALRWPRAPLAHVKRWQVALFACALFPTPLAGAPRRMWEEADGWMIERFGNIDVGDMTWEQAVWSDLVRCWQGWAR